MPGYRLSSVCPYRSQDPAVFSRSCSRAQSKQSYSMSRADWNSKLNAKYLAEAQDCLAALFPYLFWHLISPLYIHASWKDLLIRDQVRQSTRSLPQVSSKLLRLAINPSPKSTYSFQKVANVLTSRSKNVLSSPYLAWVGTASLHRRMLLFNCESRSAHLQSCRGFQGHKGYARFEAPICNQLPVRIASASSSSQGLRMQRPFSPKLFDLSRSWMPVFALSKKTVTCLLWVRLATDRGCAFETFVPLKKVDLEARANVIVSFVEDLALRFGITELKQSEIWSLSVRMLRKPIIQGWLLSEICLPPFGEQR